LPLSVSDRLPEIAPIELDDNEWNEMYQMFAQNIPNKQLLDKTKK
jgi:hypothetical protein